jgi:hypothetical protein
MPLASVEGLHDKTNELVPTELAAGPAGTVGGELSIDQIKFTEFDPTALVAVIVEL